jgi:hypothetical protein
MNNVNARIIAASNRNLEAEVEAGRFREEGSYHAPRYCVAPAHGLDDHRRRRHHRALDARSGRGRERGIELVGES